MITIARRVEDLIERWPLLRQGLSAGLLNTSAVARYLKPEVEKAIGERVSEAAVLMALRRYEAKTINKPQSQPQDYLGDISLRSNLCDFTYTNSPTLQQRLGQLVADLPSSHYFTISTGLMQTSLIFYQEYAPQVEVKLAEERLEKKVINLSALTMRLKPRHGQVPGIIAYPLQLLAWKGIPVVEFISTYDELSIVLHDEDIEAAFATLNRAINGSVK